MTDYHFLDIPVATYDIWYAEDKGVTCMLVEEAVVDHKIGVNCRLGYYLGKELILSIVLVLYIKPSIPCYL